MSAVIRVFRCECGKAHMCAGVGMASRCTCGRGLWAHMWEAGR